MIRCFICRTSVAEANRLENKRTEASGQLYSDIILNDLVNSSDLQTCKTGYICDPCSVLIEKQDALRVEAQSIDSILRRLLMKRINKDEDYEFDIDLDEAVFMYFNQKKSKFFCKSCDFTSTIFETLAAHIKYHQIVDRNEPEQETKVQIKGEYEYLVENPDEHYVEIVEDHAMIPLENDVEAQNEDQSLDQSEVVYEEELTEYEQAEDGAHTIEHVSNDEDGQKSVTTLNNSNVSLKVTTDDKNQFVCSVCLKTFKSAQSLTYHFMTHTNNYPFYCSYCNKGCKHEHQLKEHENIHIRTAKFHCKICGKPFINQGTYHHHLRWHETPNPYKCEHPDCDLRFRAKSHAKVHYMRKHSDERNFRCDVEGCGKTFATPANLKAHVKLHTADYRHKCTFCPAGYHNRRDLLRHVKREHNSEEDGKADSQTSSEC